MNACKMRVWNALKGLLKLAALCWPTGSRNRPNRLDARLPGRHCLLLLRYRSRAAVAALGLALTLSAAPVAAQDDVHVLKFNTFAANESAVWQQLLLPWIHRVESASGQRLRFEPIEMSTADKPSELLEQIKSGVADVGWTMPTWTKERFDRLEAFELPFMLTNAEAVSRAYWEYVQTYAADAFKDVRVLALHVGGPQVIHTRANAVRSLNELRNLRISASSAQSARVLAALGARPQALFAAARPTPNDESIDGVLAPWESLPAATQDVTRFHTEFDAAAGALSANTYVLAINKQTYQELPADLRKIIDDHSGLEASAWLGKTLQESDKAGRARAIGHVIALNEEDAVAFRKAAEQVEDEWVKRVTAQGYDGRKLLDGARTLIKKHTK